MRKKVFQVWTLSLLVPVFGLTPSLSLANPSGANVVHGGISFNGLGTSNLTINQSTGAAIINWQNFSIDNNEITQFVQPGVDSVAINRVVSGNPTAIYGQLSANGGVIVINPNGIVVGSTGVIDVAGSLTLSTLDASDSSLLSGQQIGGSTRYQGLTRKSIRNLGSIAAGDVTLLTNYLQNQGTILGAGGVNIGAGGDILVQRTTDGANITIQGGVPGGGTGVENSGVISGANTSIKAHGNSYSMAINNSGAIRARGWAVQGGRLKLSAGSTGRINNTGLISASRQGSAGGQVQIEGREVNVMSGRVESSGLTNGGSIEIVADDITIGSDAVVIADGVLDGGSISLQGSQSTLVAGKLSSTSVIGNGGSIDVTADQVAVDATAVVDASGGMGGSIRIGGGYQGNDADISNANFTSVSDGALILADGIIGDGGQVVIWADQDTMFSGDISAQAVGATGNGGFVEVSGKRNLTFDGFASTLANNGQNGTLLLDPTDVLISEGSGATISVSTLVGSGGTFLAPSTSGGLIHNNNVVIHTTGTGGTGNIFIGDQGSNLDDIHYSSNNSLTFLAHSDILVSTNVLNHASSGGGGHINLVAGWDGVDGSAETGLVDFAIVNSYGWGGNGGDVVINAAALQEVSVGSRIGETNLLGMTVFLSGGNGNDEFAHVGYRNPFLVDRAGFHSSGDINVYAKGTVALIGNSRSDGVDNFVMIGHGGSNHSRFNNAARYQKAAGRGSMGGNITVNALGALLMRGADDRTFAQIGHGGLGVNLNNGATDGAGTGAANGSIEGVKTGNITVLADSIDMKANDRTTEGANLGRDGSNRAGARIGHGGFDYAGGTMSGDVTVISQTGITAKGSENTDGNWGSIVQIGHGGNRASSGFGIGDNAPEATIGPDTQAFDPSVGGHSGNVIVRALNGDIRFFASDRDGAPAQIGHGGMRSHGSHTGDVTVSATGAIVMDRYYHDGIRNNGTQDIRRAGDRSHVQIGHGGYESVGRMDGDILVDSGGNFEMYGGNSQSHAMVGHGGNLQTGWVNNQGRNAHANLNGNITMNVGGDMIMKGGMNDNEAFTMVGHGGREWIADHQGGFTGNVDVNVTGSLEMASGNEDFDDWEGKTVYGNNNFALIGHGGIYSKGNHSGSVDVTTGGDLVMTSFGGWEGARDNGGVTRYDREDTGSLNFVKIGHGGYRTAFMDGPPQNGDIHFHMWTGAEPSAPQGIDAPVTVSVGGDIAMTAIKDLGDQRTGIPTIASGAPADPERRGFEGFVVIGNGSDEREGNSSRRSDEFQFYRGDVSVSAGGKIDLLGARVDNLNNLAVQVGTQAYDGIRDSYAQIGHHAGYVNRAAYWEGNIIVDAGSDIRIESGSAGASYAMVGHGGIDVGSSGRGTADIGRIQMNGDIDVWSGGNINIQGGNLSVDPTINEQYNWHQFAGIGHYNARNRSMQSGVTSSSDITVVANGDLTMLGRDNTAPAGGSDMMSQVHIGHGSGDYLRLDIESDIDVTVGGNFSLTAGTHPETDIVNFAKVGHGNRYAHGGGAQYWRRNVGEIDGDIAVKVGQNITSTGGLIGHIDTSENDDNGIIASGDTFVAASMSSSDYHQGANYGITTASKGGGGIDIASVFSSGGEGFNGELRLYMPNRPQNNISTTTFLNASQYSGTPGGEADDQSYVGETFTLNRRADEFLDYYTSMSSQVSPLLGQSRVQGSINAADPYGIVNGIGGFYHIYYNNNTPLAIVTPPVVPPVVPTVPVAPVGPPPPVPFDYTPFVGNELWEAYDWPFGLLEFDGYDTFWGNLGIGDAIDDGAYIPRSGLEEALDARFGRRTWTWRPGVEDYYFSGREFSVTSGATSYELEQAEERDRINTRATRGVGKGEGSFFIYDPGTSRYSSLRLFGHPASDVPAFSSGQ